jgi:hypothetical protein
MFRGCADSGRLRAPRSSFLNTARFEVDVPILISMSSSVISRDPGRFRFRPAPLRRVDSEFRRRLGHVAVMRVTHGSGSRSSQAFYAVVRFFRAFRERIRSVSRDARGFRTHLRSRLVASRAPESERLQATTAKPPAARTTRWRPVSDVDLGELLQNAPRVIESMRARSDGPSLDDDDRQGATCRPARDASGNSKGRVWRVPTAENSGDMTLMTGGDKVSLMVLAPAQWTVPQPARGTEGVFNEIKRVTSEGPEPILTPRAHVAHRQARGRRTRWFPQSAPHSRASNVDRRTQGAPAPYCCDKTRSGNLLPKIVSAMDRCGS